MNKRSQRADLDLLRLREMSVAYHYGVNIHYTVLSFENLFTGVDISGDERRSKCALLAEGLRDLEPVLASLRRRPGRVGPLARGVGAALDSLLS